MLALYPWDKHSYGVSSPFQVRGIKAYLVVLSLFWCFWEILQSNRQKNENLWGGAPLKCEFSLIQNTDEDLNNFKCFTSQYKTLATKQKYDEK